MRIYAAAGTVLLSAVPSGAASTASCTPERIWGQVRPELAVEVVHLVNAYRADHGLPQVVVSPTLTDAAVWKAAHLSGYFDTTYGAKLGHGDPAPPVQRTTFQRFVDCGYSERAGWGENIAGWYPTAAAVTQGWLDSPPHRRNIESPEFRAIGVGVARDPDGRLFWAQTFGSEDDGSSRPISAPIPNVDQITMLEDQQMQFDVLANDSDPEADIIGVLDVGEALHGRALIGVDYQISYEPEPNYGGPDSFTYSILDVYGLSASSNVTIHVEPVQDRPDASDDPATVRKKQHRIDVLTNDSDVDGDALIVTRLARRPRKGTARITSDSSALIYRPRQGAIGRDSLVYVIADGHGGKDRGTVRILISR